jgi:hypothetical protein
MLERLMENQEPRQLIFHKAKDKCLKFKSSIPTKLLLQTY